MKSSSAAFYGVVDARHFLGAVALVNSLRLAGHGEPIHLLDCGLEPWQADVLAREAAVHPWARADTPPHLLKLELPLDWPADVMLLLDADVVAVRSLEPLLAAAGDGAICAFADGVNRFHPEWGKLLGLGVLRPGRYVNAGILALPRAGGLEVLQRVHAGLSQVDPVRTTVAAGRPQDPFYYLDQDVLNAVLVSDANPCGIEVLPGRDAPHPPFAGLSAPRNDPLAVRYADGSVPFVLHHVGRKPWLRPTFASSYTRLLSRLLLSPDVPIRIEPSQVPLRLRRGLLAALDRKRSAVFAAVYSQRGRLGVRRRLADQRLARRERAAVHRAGRRDVE